MEIRVETDGIKNERNNMIAVSEELTSCMKQLEELIWSLSGGDWQGETQRTVEDKILHLKKRYEKLILYIESYANLLGEFADEFEDFEGEKAQKIDLI